MLTSKEKAIQIVEDTLDSYFIAMRNIDAEYNSHIGLTGGFDSRLLLIFAKRHLNNFNTNSFYRKNSLEYSIAKELAQVSGVDFVSYENQDTLNVDLIDNNLSLRFLDGQVRAQNYIDEAFSHPHYGAGLYKNHLVGFHGCGGEQYRNAERIKGSFVLKDYLFNEWFNNFEHNIIVNKKLQSKIFDNIVYKSLKLLDNNNNKQDLLTLKRFQNEIWNISNRLTRVNALNQQQFYFAPFTEWQLSVTSYSLADILGNSQEFQVRLMKLQNDVVNSVKTTYGYSINEGKPYLTRKLENFVSILPRKHLLWLYKRYKKIKARNINRELILSKEFQNYYDDFNIKKASSNRDLSGTLIAMDTLLKTMKFGH